MVVLKTVKPYLNLPSFPLDLYHLLIILKSCKQFKDDQVTNGLLYVLLYKHLKKQEKLKLKIFTSFILHFSKKAYFNRCTKMKQKYTGSELISVYFFFPAQALCLKAKTYGRPLALARSKIVD